MRSTLSMAPLTGAARTKAQLKAIWRADRQAFAATAVLMAAVAVLAGGAAGIFMTIMRAAAAGSIFPELDGDPNTLPPTIDVNPFAEDGASRFGAVPGRIVAFVPPPGDAEGAALTRRIAESAAAASGLPADRVVGFDTFAQLTAYHLDNNYDASLGVTPAEGSPGGVGVALVMLNATSMSYALSVNAGFLPWTQNITGLAPPSSDCPLEGLPEDAPSTVCSGLLSWQQLVGRAVAAELGSDAATQAPPQLRVMEIDEGSWVEAVNDPELNKELDTVLGFLYSIGPIGVTGALMSFITTQLLHMRRGSRSKQDANTSPRAYAMLRLAGMTPWQWWSSKMLFLLPLPLLFAASTTIVAAIGGSFDQVGLLGDNSGGGAGAFFLIMAVASIANMPLYAVFAAIPLFQNPHNAVSNSIRSIVSSLIAVACVALLFFTIVPAEIEALDVLSVLLVPVGLARGVAMACSAGPLAQDPSVSLGGIVALMIVGGALNFVMTVSIDRASDGSGCFCRRRAADGRGAASSGDPAVVASHISKTFRSVLPCWWHKKKKAVDDVSLRFPAGQVTVLLGHNGAGKSTLIDCILGLKRHLGSVTIFGHHAGGFGGGVTSIGFVAQGDSLDPNLTAMEHLQLFAGIHGYADPDALAGSILKEVGLHEGSTPDTNSSKLSGGQKRRLALGIAMMGDPKFIVLDEPTAGVDAEGKVQIRHLIRELKQDGRIILLTTHEMNEAEVLGDYTAIMVNGKLQCEAPTLELKKTYGVGYYLHVAHRGGDGGRGGAAGAAEAKASPARSTDELLAVVGSSVSGAVVARNTLVETLFVLPMQSSDSFPALFKALDGAGFAGLYGIEMPSLEEVFIRVTREAEDLQLRQKALEKAEKILKKKREEANACACIAACKDPKKVAAANSAQAEVDKLRSALDGDSNNEVRCPALQCGREFEVPSSAMTVTCPKCSATFPRADAAAVSGGDDDSDKEKSTLDRRHYELQPSLANSYRAFLKFFLKVGREALLSGLFTLVLYLVIAGLNARLGSSGASSALLAKPNGITEEQLFFPLNIGIAFDDPQMTATFVDGINTQAGYEVATGFDSKTALGDWVIDGPEDADFLRAGYYFPNDDFSDVTLVYSKSRVVGSVPYLQLGHLQRLLYPELAAASLPQVWPLRAGAAYMDFGSTGIVSMYICLIASIFLQSFGFGYAEDLEKGRRHQFTAMGLDIRAYYAVLFTVNGGMILLIACAFTALVFVLELPFAVQTPAFAVVLIIFFVTMDMLFWSFVVIALVRSVARWAAVSTAFMVFTMAPGMLIMMVPGFASTHFWWLDLYPPGAMAQAFAQMDRVATVQALRDEVGCDSCGFPAFTGSNVFDGSSRSLLPMLLIPIVQMLLGAAVLAVVEHRESKKGPRLAEGDGAAVARDAEQGGALPLSASGLEMSFPGPTKACGLRPGARTQVLRGVDLKVRRGELTALLGPNGAGKSTTFNIIAGRYQAAGGNVFINGKDVATRPGQAERNQRLYLVQQHTSNTLSGNTSVRAHLELMAAVKGVRDQAEIQRAVDATLSLFDLGDRSTVKVSELSGGQGRKGCAALAMLGTVIDDSGRVLVLLDEISAGVDVSSRRKMWESFARCRGEFAGLLCTHHMEEADSLCDSIAIVVEGRVVAAGSSQELKNKYGKDLQLHLTCTPEAAGNVDELVRFVDGNVGRGARLVDVSKSSGHVVIGIPAAAAPLADMFKALEAAKGPEGGHGIIDYSLAQPTLESVFIRLVRKHSKRDGSAALARSMSDL